jgi:hypothetical protein
MVDKVKEGQFVKVELWVSEIPTDAAQDKAIEELKAILASSLEGKEVINERFLKFVGHSGK